MDATSFKGQMIDQIDLRDVPHSGFDRSNHSYGTGKLGAIIPTRFDESYPGDRIKGTPRFVGNFEPLAAPLMGSMVLKQECFFVPYVELWRHAYKFFTQKDGFNESMPSLSPLAIFTIFGNSGLNDLIYNIGQNTEDGLDAIINNLHRMATTPALEHFSDGDLGTFLESLNNFKANFISWQRNVYGSRKMLDLVQPIVDYIDSFVNSKEIVDYSVLFESSSWNSKDVYKLSGVLGNFIKTIHQFFFGPSSIFDYLGFPMTQTQKFEIDAPIPEYGVSDLFSLYVYRNIFLYGHYNFLDAIENCFSQVPLNFLPFKAYYLVWYWNYRDQLLESGILDPDEDEFLGSEITDNVVIYCTMLRQRCWFKDAFTTALTNTGDGNLLVPTGTPDGQTNEIKYYDAEDVLINTTDSDSAYKAGATVCEVSSGSYKYRVPMNYLVGAVGHTDKESSEVSYLSLDLFDRIQRLRSFIQKKLVLGYEVDDVVFSSFMVRMSNIRLHIPELLGRGRDSVEISTIVNNTSTAQQIAGDKTATAWTQGSISDVNYFCEEWGFYIQFATIMPIQSYSGGMQRFYLKTDVYDFMWPEFATMGMDAIYNCELSSLGKISDSKGLNVFGYQGRYYDLKYRQDEEHGRLLTDLNYLTFSREFDDPKLNYIFVHCWPRLDGFVIESPLIDVFRYDCYTAQGWERRLPVPSQFVH